MPVHRYIPNSDPEVKKEMLKVIGVGTAEELFEMIPEKIAFKQDLNLPHSASEYEVRRHVEEILAKNKDSSEMLSFLGSGCWPHYVPAVCDEINSRSEFLTAYAGDVYSDLGRYQALFEFQSMIGDLVAMDAVTCPTYDWASAAGDALRMATIITGRRELLVPRNISPDKLSIMTNYCGDVARIKLVDYDPKSGQMEIEDLKNKVGIETATVYIENTSYLGVIETQGKEIDEIAHDKGALLSVGVEPLSLGILAPPGEYGADIVCGETQPLGLYPNYGGASAGFLACPDDEKFLSATGHRLISITTTKRKGEWGFVFVLPERCMYAARDKSASITGTSTFLWAITGAVYLSLLGPKGIRELAETIMKNSYYAMKRLSEVSGLKVPLFLSPHFEEFTVNFDETGRTVRDLNKALLKYGVLGGKDISDEFPELGNTAVYCTTEIHTKEDIDKLVSILGELVN
jgi:glycine cleavage system P protein (glycine dehydrogenase) subunit 1